MIDDVDQWMRTADPAADLPLTADGAARDAMRAITHPVQRFSRLQLTVLSTVALVAVGGGVAVAAPAVRNIFEPEVSVRDVAVVSRGSATVRCTSTIETSLKLGDIEQHQATVKRWHTYAEHHDQTVRVPADSSRLEINVAVGRASFDLIDAFNGDDPGQKLQDAADVFTTIHCLNLPSR